MQRRSDAMLAAVAGDRPAADDQCLAGRRAAVEDGSDPPEQRQPGRLAHREIARAIERRPEIFDCDEAVGVGEVWAQRPAGADGIAFPAASRKDAQAIARRAIRPDGPLADFSAIGSICSDTDERTIRRSPSRSKLCGLT